MPQLDRTIIAVIDDWVSAYEGDDPERVIDLYAEDAVVAVQGRATVNGRQDIAALLRNSFSRCDRKVSVRYDRAEVEGRWAYVYGHQNYGTLGFALEALGRFRNRCSALRQGWCHDFVGVACGM